MSSPITVLSGESHPIPQNDEILFYGDFMAIAKPKISVNSDTGVSERFVRTVRMGSGLHMPGGGIYGVDLRASLATAPIIQANMTYTISGNIAPYTGKIIPNFYCSEIGISSAQMEDQCERKRPVTINACGTILSVSGYQSKWEGGGFIYKVTMRHELTLVWTIPFREYTLLGVGPGGVSSGLSCGDVRRTGRDKLDNWTNSRHSQWAWESSRLVRVLLYLATGAGMTCMRVIFATCPMWERRDQHAMMSGLF
ncbi:hypothetical protein PTTG_29498 [Puccinia triticina 1-1 BBBD Race 1]|uniref:Uncharacterized protein n=1 Tax=Puccinia triticina (isolate 1-1 / race 1 (BBBD)) TaxID=630390 RepID=A0A180G3R6_PUCT1|nr:hypothetical protein PTTG_29498 [Puccinia triticina 1-1 BBBD Race 1]